MTKILKIIVCLLLILFVSNCKTISNITGINKKVCLVLSVGGAKGLSHIGAIEAIRQKKIRINCVFGNSMGAVIGGIYAQDPESDLRFQLKGIIARYMYKTKSEKLFGSLILGGISFLLSGGVLGWETIAAGITGGVLVDNFSNSRFEKVLNDHFKNKNIEETIIPFATSYQIKEGEGITLKIASSGNLAHSISKSANNPFIFSDSKLDKIDPGSDRISSVPIEDACRFFNPTKIIAINVTGNKPTWSSKMNCPVKVIDIEINENIDMRKVIKMTGKDFEYILEKGYDGVIENL